MSGFASETRENTPLSPGPRSASARVGDLSISPSRVGIGSPWGSWVGLPSFAAISSDSSGEIACSSFSASSCTRSHGMPSASARYSSSRRWWRTTSSATRSPAGVSCTPWYGSREASPSDSSRLTIADADAGDTPSRSASAEVDTGRSSRCAIDQIALA